jgi:hypothetical protein
MASGPGGGGTGGGGGGGGSTSPVVVCFSNLDASGKASSFAGWALTGIIDTTGFFDYQGEQFMAGASGKLTRLRIPVYRTNTGGNSTVNMYLYADDPLNPGTPGALLQTIAVTPWPDYRNAGTPVDVNVSNGATLTAGQHYWLIGEPRSQLRAAWSLNVIGEVGPHIYVDNLSGVTYTVDVQGAFEVDVQP